MTNTSRVPLIMMSLVLMIGVPIIAFAYGAKEKSSPSTQNAMTANTATVVVSNSTKWGNILADQQGMTLYVFAKGDNSPGQCTGACLKAWPPLVVKQGQTPTGGSGLSGALGTVKRPDGSLQVTYNGMPLYLFIHDKTAGVVNGQNLKTFGGTWYVVPPKATTIAQAGTMSNGSQAGSNVSMTSTSSSSSSGSSGY